jgi:hypothetical protein
VKENQITLATSAAVFVAALWVRQTFFTDASAHGRYYVSAVLGISGVLTVIFLCRLILAQRMRSSSDPTAGEKPSRRDRLHYRIRFDRPPQPVFVQKTDDRQPGPAFTCPVLDISETGISLACTGVYTLGQTVQGELIFCSGRTAPINGIVIREEKDRSALNLHCAIDPPLLMAEQREQIVLQKAAGPQPAVSRTLLEKDSGSLPSHSPKGICRLKRP